jgi:hypothetical protein
VTKPSVSRAGWTLIFIIIYNIFNRDNLLLNVILGLVNHSAVSEPVYQYYSKYPGSRCSSGVWNNFCCVLTVVPAIYDSWRSPVAAA